MDCFASLAKTNRVIAAIIAKLLKLNNHYSLSE